ncbi:hypothetical protein KBY55_04375 [Streptomyces sp. b94]|nr:hypothetical protein [Streptomyces sp. b94]
MQALGVTVSRVWRGSVSGTGDAPAHGTPRRIRDEHGADLVVDGGDVRLEGVRQFRRGARPGDAVFGEESGQRGHADAVRQWPVDPLCGTLDHAAGNPLVAVNAALRDGPAAVADPLGAEVCFTDGDTARI